MLDVASLEKFELLNKLRLVSGANGLYRNITNVVILDYEGIEGDFSGFHEGDFVITNLLLKHLSNSVCLHLRLKLSFLINFPTIF